MLTSNMIVRFLGFHIDPDSWSGGNAVINNIEPSTRPGLVEVITDSIPDDFSISGGKTGSITEVAAAQAIGRDICSR